MTFETYDILKASFKIVEKIFFREIRTSGVNTVPPDGPCIFIINHNSQFLDAGLVLGSNPRQFAPLMAQSSFKMKLVGTLARLLHAIPVIRPQDLATKGTGTLELGQEGDVTIRGKNTRFTQEIQSRDQLTIGKTMLLPVLEVVSDTELKLKTPLDKKILAAFSQQQQGDDGINFKITPHVEQGELFEKVHERLADDGCIVIFPEGGSHDRSELLPLKAGFAIMALGAMAEKENLNVKIVPVGLNYFHPHRFRSRAVISYGTPIEVSQDLVDKYKQGGDAKREAISTVLNDGYEGLKSVTTNAPDYDTLMILAAARRLYKPAHERKLRIDQVVDLNRRFLLGYRFFKDDPRYKELENKVKAYNNHLKYFGLYDHQVKRTETTLFSVAPVLMGRLIQLFIFALLGFPALLTNLPIILVVRIISLKKQKRKRKQKDRNLITGQFINSLVTHFLLMIEALAGSSVKIAARDVLATWKVIVALVVTPLLYGSYSTLLFGYLGYFAKLGWKASFGWSVVAFFAQFIFAYVGIRFVETGLEVFKSIQPLVLAIFEPDAAANLRKMRERLADDVTDFVNENGPVVLDDFDPTRFDNLESKKKAAADSWKWTGLFDTTKVDLIHHWFDDHNLFNLSSSSEQ
ncbi:hypothetical protein BCR42DRAFT_422997 [Absidia repens]|uniref:Phospholipid/glycerol acyltransferase domain-containing protein n=1 Tax=Absidia repens TaxID=90262 RepID=A0A1X2I683_9FUNG|nr:hypothetical protein BCR42DRAFT_422997 [Absidia repens]